MYWILRQFLMKSVTLDPTQKFPDTQEVFSTYNLTFISNVDFIWLHLCPS